ncbi:MAG: hypothetical protein WDN03_02340 [Rhizomicrobium sp.]
MGERGERTGLQGVGAVPRAEDVFGNAPAYRRDTVLATAPMDSDEQQNLRDLLNLCKQSGRPPIILLFGFSYSGKTALALRLQDIFQNRGYGVSPAVGPKAPAERTNKIQPYFFSHPRRPSDAFVLVDLPGERFSRAKEANFSDAVAKETLALMAAADAYLLLLEADKTLYLEELRGQGSISDFEAKDYQEVVATMVQFAKLDWQLARKLGRHGDIEAAAKAIAEMKPEERFRELSRGARASRKPVLLGLSIADRLHDNMIALETGVLRKRLEARGETRPVSDAERATIGQVVSNFDRDPLLLLNLRQKKLVAQVMSSFRYFRADFLTSFAGLPANFTGAVNLAHYPPRGVERNFDWLRDAAVRSRGGRLRTFARKSRLLHPLVQALDWLPSLAETSWALDARAAWDEALRHAR